MGVLGLQLASSSQVYIPIFWRDPTSGPPAPDNGTAVCPTVSRPSWRAIGHTGLPAPILFAHADGVPVGVAYREFPHVCQLVVLEVTGGLEFERLPPSERRLGAVHVDEYDDAVAERLAVAEHLRVRPGLAGPQGGGQEHQPRDCFAKCVAISWMECMR